MNTWTWMCIYVYMNRYDEMYAWIDMMSISMYSLYILHIATNMSMYACIYKYMIWVLSEHSPKDDPWLVCIKSGKILRKWISQFEPFLAYSCDYLVQPVVPLSQVFFGSALWVFVWLPMFVASPCRGWFQRSQACLHFSWSESFVEAGIACGPHLHLLLGSPMVRPTGWIV